MKVVIDTQILLRSIPSKSIERCIYDAFAKNKFTWIFSTEILLEYAELLERMYSTKTMEVVISVLLHRENAQRFEPFYKWQLVTADADDNKFVDCAIGANVDFLVSDDKHILSLRKTPHLFPPITIITFKQFERILASK